MKTAAPKPSRPESRLALLQLIPLIMVVMFATACSGSGGPNEPANDFFTSRRTDLFLRGFIDVTNTNNPSAILSSWAPSLLGNVNFNQPITQQISFDEAVAELSIRNGVSAVLEKVTVKFTEVDGSDVTNFSTTPPTPLTGQFDFQLLPNLSLIASPLTSIGQGLADPSVAAAPTTFRIPVQMYSTRIWNFQTSQPAPRPLLGKVTFAGHDILGNVFNVVGFLLMDISLRQADASKKNDEPKVPGT